MWTRVAALIHALQESNAAAVLPSSWFERPQITSNVFSCIITHLNLLSTLAGLLSYESYDNIT
jgi:hypothetical protein